MNKAVLAIAGLALMIIISVSERSIFVHTGFTATTENTQKMDEVKDVFSWVNSRAEKNARIVYQSTFENGIGNPVLEQSHVLTLAMYYTPFMSILTCGVGNHYPTYDYVETDSGKIFGKPIDKISHEEIMGRMRAFNARYIVTLEPRLRDKIAGIGEFQQVKKVSDFTVFEYSGLKNEWLEFTKKDPANHYEIEEFGDSRLKIKMHNSKEENEAIVKIAYHPFWQVGLNGVKGRLDKGPLGLMSIELPERGDFIIDLKYNSKKPIPISVSVIALITCSFLALPFGKKSS